MEETIVGRSKSVEQLKKLITKLAKGTKDVLIVGEPGVGKGVVARRIHTEQFGQMQFFCVTVSLAFPLAQNSIPLRCDSLKVGQPGQMHAFTFSGLSATTPTSKHLHISYGQNLLRK